MRTSRNTGRGFPHICDLRGCEGLSSARIIGEKVDAVLGRFVRGTIDQDDIGRAFVGEFLHGQDGTIILENAAMKQRSQAY